MALHDPDLPTGAIVEVFDDGDALRNDGVRLTAARKNPWYVLATVAGEHNGFLNMPIQKLNKRIWNGWMCHQLDQSDAAKIARKMGVSEHELSKLSVEETKTLHTRFQNAFPGQDPSETLQSLLGYAHFDELYFKSDCYFDQFYMPRHSNFARTSFHRYSSFISTFFAGELYFSEAQVNGDFQFSDGEVIGASYFESSNFGRAANFNSVTFRSSVSFRSANFIGPAFFDNADFNRHADFSSTDFSSRNVFMHANFAGNTNFTDGAQKGRTDFRRAHFNSHVPTFYQREMHQETTFTEDPAYWPTPTPDNAQEGKQAYTRLRQIAAGNQNPDLEHFFLRQEMRCKEVLATGIDRMAFAAYRIFADYGISVARPVAGLAITIAIGWALIPAHLKACADCETSNFIWEGLGISIGNTLPFLGLVGKMHPDFHTHAPAWIDALSALQSIVGIILLFFLALGLRNRFRLK